MTLFKLLYFTIKNFKLEDITLLIKNYYYIRTKIKTVETKINKTKTIIAHKSSMYHVPPDKIYARYGKCISVKLI